jgi:two-component system phosphate regulon response regulator OmpR
VQINRLRRKIEKNPADPLYLRTVRGVGYRLVITP